MVNLLLTLILVLMAVPTVGACVYLLLLTFCSAALPPLPPSSRKLRFEIVVPAHNEVAVLGRAVATLKDIDWPADQFQVIVVADNCTDETAAVAVAAGAQALVRNDLEKRGKGYALDYAFNASLARGWADAVVVVDADAEVSRNILEAFAQRIEQGAHAVQVHYGVSNTGTSWRTRLLSIAKAAFHIVRSRARERLGMSCGIRGNGWAVTHRVLRDVPYRCFSLTEDLEYGIELGLAGFRVHYADEAHSNAEMVSGGAAAGKQRQRWEKGRFQMVGSRTWPLLRAASAKRSLVCLDLALDLLVLPLSYLAMNVALLGVIAALATMMVPGFVPWLWVAAGCCLTLFAYVLRGWQLSGTGAQGLLDLLRAPFFMAWKVFLMLRWRGTNEWVRTKREDT